jgi:hypothetical protein
MTTTALPQKNCSKAIATKDSWLTTSVQTFFSGFNWENAPPEIQEIQQTASVQATSGPLSLSLSVGQFFAAINWHGSEIAAPVAVEQPSIPQPAANDDLTLDDFSSLF